MNNLPLHNYFTNLGVVSSLCRNDVVLVDDNARVSHPSQAEDIRRKPGRKMSRWDSAGCLPRMPTRRGSDRNDSSPSVLNKKKRTTINAAEAAPTSSIRPSRLQRCHSEQLVGATLTQNASFQSQDKPLRHPVRATAPNRKIRKSYSGSIQSSSDENTPSKSTFEREGRAPLPAMLCRQLPYEITSTHELLSAPLVLEELRRSDAPADPTRCTTGVESSSPEPQFQSSFSSRSTKTDSSSSSSSSSVTSRLSPTPGHGKFSAARTA